MTERIRIDDLAEPVLSPHQEGALAFGESVDTDLSVEAVLGAAVVQADSSRPRSATKSRYSPRSLQGSSRPDSGDHRNA